MIALRSWIFFGVFFTCLLGCYASCADDWPAYVCHETSRTDKICYAGVSPTLTFEQAANEQSEIEGESGLGQIVLGTIEPWDLREGCESGTVINQTTEGVVQLRGLPIRNQDSCGACWAYAHADFISLWHCEHGNTNDMTKMTQVASLQQHGMFTSS